MITDTMSWDEVSSHILKIWNKFDNDRKFQKYLRSLKFDPYLKHQDNLIRKPMTTHHIGHNEIVYCIPFQRRGENPKVMLFTIFRYKNRKFVAFNNAEENHSEIFSWHSIVRYFERCKGISFDENIVIDPEKIGLVMVHNSNGGAIPFFLKNNEDFNFIRICKDGAFLGRRDEIKSITKTFVTREMMFEFQKDINDVAWEIICRNTKTGNWEKNESSPLDNTFHSNLQNGGSILTPRDIISI